MGPMPPPKLKLKTQNAILPRMVCTVCGAVGGNHVVALPSPRLKLADNYSRDLELPEWGSGVSLHRGNREPSMSALGQKRTFTHLQPMSALPPRADIGTQACDVRFVPKADICRAANSTLFDHLVGACE